MTVVRLVRHAMAGTREAWVGDDAERPLDEVGRGQAVALADSLRREVVGRLLSSPTRRCIETLEPLATAKALPITPLALLEADADADGQRLRHWLLEDARDGDVLCTHGETMQRLLGLVDGHPDHADGSDLLAKGSYWELAVEGEQVRRVSHQVPAN